MFAATTVFYAHQKQSHNSSKSNRNPVRRWVVVEDPSGDFLGRSFRAFDLNGAADNYWPEMIVFENETTGERRTWEDGRFIHSFPPAKNKGKKQKAI
jgi:hypothetical protein